MYPTRGVLRGCCACAASGNAAAAPPRRVMNSRRFVRSNCTKFLTTSGGPQRRISNWQRSVSGYWGALRARQPRGSCRRLMPHTPALTSPSALRSRCAQCSRSSFTTVQKRRLIYTVGDAQARFSRMKSTSKKRTPSIVNLTVKPRYLTERDVERLMDCARKHGRYGHRDATMILVAYRHGLRASEVCDLQWQQIELSEGRLHVHRVKNGIASVHPIRGDEMRALRKLRCDYPRDAHVFVSERGGPISPIGFHRLI